VIFATILLLACLPSQMGGNDETEAVYEYLFTPQQQQAFDALRTQAGRERFLAGFWRGLDPSPETDYNELRELFLRRIEFANLYYPLEVAKGWRSDRGKVLLFFGFPSSIRRSRFSPSEDAKYEIWTYGGIRGEETVQLIFKDEYDSGDFVLQTPVEFPKVLSLNPELPRISGGDGDSGGIS